MSIQKNEKFVAVTTTYVKNPYVENHSAGYFSGLSLLAISSLARGSSAEVLVDIQRNMSQRTPIPVATTLDLTWPSLIYRSDSGSKSITCPFRPDSGLRYRCTEIGPRLACASVTSAFWPTANAPRSYRFAFSCIRRNSPPSGHLQTDLSNARGTSCRISRFGENARPINQRLSRLPQIALKLNR